MCAWAMSQSIRCGDAIYGGSFQVPDNYCYYTCSGNNEICGSQGFMSLYQNPSLVVVGRFYATKYVYEFLSRSPERHS